jgi:hypothetical protein
VKVAATKVANVKAAMIDFMAKLQYATEIGPWISCKQREAGGQRFSSGADIGPAAAKECAKTAHHPTSEWRTGAA